MPEKAQKKDITKEEIVEKALDLAAAQGWDTVSLGDIAESCGLSLAELFEYIEDKTDILAALGRMIDKKVLENMSAQGPDISPRDRLFDIMMERYEILNDYRPGLTAILNSFLPDPKQAVISLPHLCRSMTWMLEAAGIETTGLRGALKVAGLSGVYLKVLKTWKEDDSADLSKTMAALDRDLGRAERLADLLAF